MRKLSLILLLASICVSAISQETRSKYILTFKQGQTELNKKQKSEFLKIASSLNDGEIISIYPLVGKVVEASPQSIAITARNMRTQGNLKFDRKAKEQAAAIAEHAKNHDFEIIGTPMNFPSAYRGVSASVNMKYNKPKTLTSIPAGRKPKQKTTPLKERYPEKPSQYFTINPNKDTLITGDEGTKLLFEAGCLMTNKDKIEIELKEFYGLDDYIKGDLLTVSNGRMLQTGGSIYLDAKEKGNPSKQVRINPEKGVGVDFTLGKDDSKMEIFIKDPKSKQTNWIRPSIRVMRTSYRMTYTMKRNGIIIDKLIFTSKEEWAAFKAELDAKVERERQEVEERRKKLEAKRERREKIKSKLAITNFGYINCDRFPNEPLIPLIVSADQEKEAEYYLVFKDVRGIMKGFDEGDKVRFGQVPRNKKAILIAISFIGDQAFFSKSTIIPGVSKSSKIDLKPVSESYVDQQLALLK